MYLFIQFEKNTNRIYQYRYHKIDAVITMPSSTNDLIL